MGDGGFRTGLLIGGLAVTVVGLGLALILSSGGDSSGTTTTTVASTTPTTGPTTPQEATTTRPATTTTAANGPVSFASPTRNIVCRVTENEATCGILQFNYSPPPDVGGCGTGRWGHALAVGLAGAGGFICSNQPPAEPSQVAVLAYGYVLALGPFRCGSSRIGLFCQNRQTHHGIALSRDRARAF
jgi:hypothetical protein